MGEENYKKQIKDLKEYNKKLKNQYELCDTRKIHLEMEKNNLIKYLEDKINHIQQLINCKNKKVKPYGEELHFYQSMIFMYKDILERIKSGNYE